MRSAGAALQPVIVGADGDENSASQLKRRLTMGYQDRA
jgi:hypothetical protein